MNDDKGNTCDGDVRSDIGDDSMASNGASSCLLELDLAEMRQGARWQRPVRILLPPAGEVLHSMGKVGVFRSMKGGCVPTALWKVSGKRPDRIMSTCKKHGWNEKGMTNRQWTKASKELGVWLFRGKLGRRKPTVGEFMRENPHGCYLVTTYNHIFVIWNGVMYDPRHFRLYNKGSGMVRRVEGVWLVINPKHGII